ncbi:MAG: fimbrial biogenesis outer membrane usher protein [Deltaproteobacteria bacterium]|nr:fimbrial biogenesis outer membrane usher protein [Deltaproteobacteria bacterium]
MSINQCASSNLAKIPVPLVLLILLISLCGVFPASSFASQTIVVNIILNRETKGEFFVNLTDDGDFLVKTADLQAMGITGSFPEFVTIENEPHVSLKSFSGVTFAYSEKNLTLEITATPTLLPTQILDFAPKDPMKVYYPKDSSAFLNYRLDYFSGNSFRFQGLNVTNELGVRSGDFLLLTDSLYTKNDTSNSFVRLSSSLIYDRRQEMERIVLGDVQASSGDLGVGLNLGGLSLSKLYRINPYFINRPTAGLSGLVSLPSDMEVYLNGSRIRTERLSPGEFDLRNITGYGGSSQVEVVLRDPFGREQRIGYPFYFTDILLKKGLHEYSYNLGAIRRDFGVKSNSYGKMAFLGFHNYGITDFLTIGLRGEWAGSAGNMGPQASFLSPVAGTFTASVSGSYDGHGRTGVAGLFGYGYQGRNFSARLFLKGANRDYATIDPLPSTIKTQYEANAGIGYSSMELGSLNLDFASAKIYQGDTARTVTASYSRNLTSNINLFASYKKTLEPVTGDEFFVGINYYPGRQINLSANYRKTGDANTETLVVQKNQPIGEGLGFQASLERTDADNFSLNSFNPSIQYNGPHGIYGVDYSWLNSNSGTRDSSRLSVSGAIAFIGNSIGFIRPVSDSFALVKVGEIEGVRINLNNQEMARTNASGEAFVPDMGSFNYNQVSITDKDISMDYLLSAKLRYISPPYRSGSCVVFDATRVQAVTGTVYAKIGNETKSLEYNEIIMIVDGKPVTLQTGSGGEFYLDNYSIGRADVPDIQDMGCSALERTNVTPLKPGRYKASVSYEGKACSFAFDIPGSSEMIIDLGKITCEFPVLGESSLLDPPIQQNGK